MRWTPAGAYRFRGCAKRGPDRFHADFAGIVRRDDDAGMAPERMPRRQWFGREHIECCAGKLAVFQRSEQIGFDQMLAAADLDQVAATVHAGERLAVENALG